MPKRSCQQKTTAPQHDPPLTPVKTQLFFSVSSSSFLLVAGTLELASAMLRMCSNWVRTPLHPTITIRHKTVGTEHWIHGLSRLLYRSPSRNRQQVAMPIRRGMSWYVVVKSFFVEIQRKTHRWDSPHALTFLVHLLFRRAQQQKHI